MGMKLSIQTYPIHTRYRKIGLIVVNNQNTDALIMASKFREKNIPVNIAWGKSVKGQLNYFRNSGWSNNLIYIGEKMDFFIYQDTYEYSDICKEYGTINFQKIEYPISEEGINQCISEQLLIELYS